MPHRRFFLLLLAGLFSLPAFACGSFAPAVRPTPSPTATKPVKATSKPTATATLTVNVRPTIIVLLPTATSTPHLPIGGQGWIVSRRDLNVRSKPTSHSTLIGKLPPHATVTIKDGPREADGYTWWLVDDGYGLLGWIAEGDATDQWLIALPMVTPTPLPGQIAPGRTVVVITQGASWLAMHQTPSRFAETLRRYPPGSKLTIIEGPVAREGYHWWHAKAADGNSGWLAEGDNEDRWLKLLTP